MFRVAAWSILLVLIPPGASAAVPVAMYGFTVSPVYFCRLAHDIDGDSNL